MKEKKPTIALLFYTLLCVFFFIDLAAFFLFEKPLIYSLLCFYILQLSRPMGIIRMVMACLLLSFPPLIQYDRFGLELLYLIPATFLGISMRKISMTHTGNITCFWPHAFWHKSDCGTGDFASRNQHYLYYFYPFC